MQRIIYILTIILITVSCTKVNPYEGSSYVLTVTVNWPEGEYERGAVVIRVEDMNLGSIYSASPDDSGKAVFTLPNGLYRINLTGKTDSNVFNASADKIVIANKELAISLDVFVSKAGSIVIKEIYCGGCNKLLPLQGEYQSDQYFILHNNDYHLRYLDRLCFGMLPPSTSSNPWLSDGNTLPDFLPLLDAGYEILMDTLRNPKTVIA